MIIGYPPLAQFGRTVDTGGNCLHLLDSPEAPSKSRDSHAVKSPRALGEFFSGFGQGGHLHVSCRGGRGRGNKGLGPSQGG